MQLSKDLVPSLRSKEHREIIRQKTTAHTRFAVSHLREALMKYKYPVTKSHQEMKTRTATCLSTFMRLRKGGNRVGTSISTTHLLQECQIYMRKNIQLRSDLSANLREFAEPRKKWIPLGIDAYRGPCAFSGIHHHQRKMEKPFQAWQLVFSLEDFLNEAIR